MNRHMLQLLREVEVVEVVVLSSGHSVQAELPVEFL